MKIRIDKDEEVKNFRFFKNLKIIKFDIIRSKGIEYLCELPNLCTMIKIAFDKSCEITDNELKIIANAKYLTNLKIFYVKNSRATD